MEFGVLQGVLTELLRKLERRRCRLGTPRPVPTQPRASNQTRIDWEYDGAGRLVEEAFNHYDNSLDFTANYEFDITGNRLKKTTDNGSNNSIDEAITYIYDNNDRLTTENIDTGNNGSVDSTNTYGYTGTQQTSKTVSVGGSVTTLVTNSYDLQGRMNVVVTETKNGSGTVTRRERVTYNYDSDGIRVSALHEINANADVDNTYESATLTEYLVENSNPTGYQQVLVERVTDALTNTETKRVVYTLGHDVIAQTTYTPSGPIQGETLVLHYDGHGSTRILTNLLAAVATIGGQRQLFFYDAYGNALGFNPALAGTTHLYSGEQFDSRISQQYLRARYYDSTTGRFNSLDPFTGNKHDPQSLHKYLYVHGDPINGIDPTGKWLGATLGIAFRSGLTAGFLSAGGTAIYGISKGLYYGFDGEWSLSNTFWRSLAAFGIGFTAGFAGGFSWSYLVLAAGVSTQVASIAIGIIVGPSGIAMLGLNAARAFNGGDTIDKVFAIADVFLAVYGSGKMAVFKWGTKDVAFYDGGRKNEIDVVIPHTLAIEDKGITTANLQIGANRNNRTLSAQAKIWADDQIYDGTVKKISLLKTATRTGPEEGGARIVPTIEKLNTIKNFHYRIDSEHPDVKNAVESAIQRLKSDYPSCGFSVYFGKR